MENREIIISRKKWNNTTITVYNCGCKYIWNNGKLSIKNCSKCIKLKSE